MLVVGAGVSDGIYTNQAYIRDPLGSEVSNRAEAVVRVTPEHSSRNSQTSLVKLLKP